jgi:nucleoside-diphosphate-sugar epimerase
MQVAVTGVTGCLGRALIQNLTENGFHLRLLVRPHERHIFSSLKKAKIIVGDINSPEALANLTKDVEIVFHLAGKVHSLPKSDADENEFYRVNTEGTRLLVEAAAKNKAGRIVFYSTVGVYGEVADFHGDELSPYRPVSVYAKSKYMAEQLVSNSRSDGGAEGVILRFPVVYGPLDRGNVAKLIKAVRGIFFFFFGDGSSLRSMISSRNAAAAAIKAAFEPKAANEVFCVTDGRDYTMNELIGSICHALGTNRRPFHIPALLPETIGKFGDMLEEWAHISFPINSDIVRKLSRPLTFSCEKSKRVLGYEPVETLEEGIRREVEWLYPEIISTGSPDYID